MGGSAHLSFSVGGLLVAGGAFGWAKKGSLPSLAAGAISGGLLIGSGVLIQKGHHFEGHSLGAAVSAAVAAAMGARFVKSRAMMPAGGVALLTSASAAYHCKKAIDWK